MQHVDRRRFLEFGVAGAAAALGGCLSSGRNESSTYTDWIPTTGDRLRTAYADLTISQASSDIDPLLPLALPSGDGADPAEFTPDFSEVDDLTDPLLEIPLQTGSRVIVASSLSLAFAGLGYLVDPAEPTVGVTELFLVDSTIVGTGEIDAAKADEALRSGTPGPFGDLRFEVVDDGDEYTTYEPSGEETGTAAVSDSAVLVADTREQVRAVLDARRGDRGRAVEEDDDVAWLFDAAGTGDILVGWQGPVEFEDFSWGGGESALETGVVSAQNDVVASVALSPEAGDVTAGFALRDPDLDGETGDRLASRLGSSAQERSVTVEDDRVSATATYPDDVLDVELVEPGRTTQRTTVPDGDDLPPEVAAAVPEDAFEFSYDEDQGTVRVNFVAEFEADRVTVTAVESENEVSTSSVGAVNYLNVFVGSGGDEVVVTVTVDGETGAVAREEVA